MIVQNHKTKQKLKKITHTTQIHICTLIMNFVHIKFIIFNKKIKIKA